MPAELLATNALASGSSSALAIVGRRFSDVDGSGNPRALGYCVSHQSWIFHMSLAVEGFFMKLWSLVLTPRAATG